VVKEKDFGMVVPAGWRAMPALVRGPMRLYRSGDGIGLPAVDETGSPLQIGMTVEKFAAAKETVDAGVDALVKAAKSQPALDLVGKEQVEAVTLRDGTEAKLLTMEFIKEGRRRSLYMKLVAKDGAGNSFVVSGFVVGGLKSTLPTKGSVVATWLRAHVESFVLDAGKVDTTKMEEVYRVFGASTRPAVK
jgi:hypothetical protein